MGTSLLVVVAFLVVTAGVIALARRSTARWERDKRAAVAARAEAPARRGPADGAAFGRPAARGVIAALRRPLGRIPPGDVLGRLLPPVREVGASTARSVRRSASGAGAALARAAGRARRWTRHAPAPPADGGAAPGSGRRPLLHRTARRARRRGFAFLHRSEDSRQPGTRHGAGDEHPTAR